jgi:uncharacterized membrane-anchored protein
VKYLVLFLAALAQITTVGWMIGKREHILARGTPVKFVAAPRDPADPFHGRYVALRLDATFRSNSDFNSAIDTWANIELDQQGYAIITTLTEKKPVGRLCLRVREVQLLPDPRIQNYSSTDTEDLPDVLYNCDFPFDRYYMNEKAAPEAEESYRKATRATPGKDDAAHRRDTYLVVRVLNGEGVAEQLYVDGKPVEELLAEKR